MRNILIVFILLAMFIMGYFISNREPVVVKINSIDTLINYYEDINFTQESWEAGRREIPRISFEKVSDIFTKNEPKITLKDKKSLFFRLMANEEILHDREKLQKEKLSSSWMLELAKKYRVIKKDAQAINEQELAELKKRVDIIPLSLALAQSAQESAWGTSRFAHEGNSLFGVWDFSGKGIKPKQQRKSLGNYTLAKYDTPLDSVKGYMFTINVGGAYEALRTLRQTMRKKDEKLSGYTLASTLTKYSEEGEVYVKSLHKMMTYNKLLVADEAYLAQSKKVYILKKIK